MSSRRRRRSILRWRKRSSSSFDGDDVRLGRLHIIVRDRRSRLRQRHHDLTEIAYVRRTTACNHHKSEIRLVTDTMGSIRRVVVITDRETFQHRFSPPLHPPHPAPPLSHTHYTRTILYIQHVRRQR